MSGSKANFRCMLQASCLLMQRLDIDKESEANFRCRLQSSCFLKQRLNKREQSSLQVLVTDSPEYLCRIEVGYKRLAEGE